MKFIYKWLPEIILTVFATFFFFRELGTFPAVWTDDGLYMIVAKEIAAGKGISLPILNATWHLPSILHVGPPLLYPVAWMIKIFGFSVEIARLPMVIYMILAAAFMYLFTWRELGKNDARLATAMLISLSAFVNTGKPVLGEIPAFFFLILGLYLLTYQNKIIPFMAGTAFGISAMTKLTFAIIFPVLIAVLILNILKKDIKNAQKTILTFITSLIIFLPWQITIFYANKWNIGELVRRFPGSGDSAMQFLPTQPELLLRMPYLFFTVIFMVGMIGMWNFKNTKNDTTIINISVLLVLCFVFYFLIGPGWYRHILPAHLILLPWIFSGFRKIASEKAATLILLFFITAQSAWQLDHRGSSTNNTASKTAQIIKEQFSGKDIIIRQSPIFVRLPKNKHWRFLPHEPLVFRIPVNLTAKTEEEKCIPELTNIKNIKIEDNFQKINDYYALLQKDSNCKK